MKKILLIGCGNIGFRHLQALCGSQMAGQIGLTIIEPNTAHHSRITDELGRTPVQLSEVSTALPTQSDHFDLVIIATNADVRRRVFDDLVGKHTFTAILFEKVLFQRIEDLDAVAAQLQGVAAHVNCGRRGFAGYQMLRDTLSSDTPVDYTPIDYTVVGTQYALASNAIHFLDIAACINQSPLVSLDASGLDQAGGDSKRAGYVEIYGTLKGTLENGATVSLTCTPADALSLDISIAGAALVGKIDEAAGTATVTRGDVTQTLAFETRHVSGMPYLYETLLNGEGCLLPTYAESAAQHRLLLSAINTHLTLPDQSDTLCPIS
jgi:predicted dehydrogenase